VPLTRVREPGSSVVPASRPVPSAKEYGQPLSEVRVLVERFQGGDQHAFADLYRLYEPRVTAFVRSRVRDSHLAEDLTADVFTRVVTALPKLRLCGDDLGGWLITIAKNVITDHYRKLGTRPVLTLTPRAGMSLVDEVTAAGAPEETTVQRDQVLAAIRMLPQRQQAVVAHHLLMDRSVEETAAVLGFHESKVKHSLRKARQSLAAALRLEEVAVA
jgi:RNA polymerase sigma-70 factor (ECF subfamily)